MTLKHGYLSIDDGICFEIHISALETASKRHGIHLCLSESLVVVRRLLQFTRGRRLDTRRAIPHTTTLHVLGSSHRLVPAAQPPYSYPPAWTTARESVGFSPYMVLIGQRLELVSSRWPRLSTWPVIALKTCINTSSTLATPWCSRDCSSILCPNPAREQDAPVQRFPLTHTCIARVGDPHHSARTVNRQCQSSRDA